MKQWLAFDGHLDTTVTGETVNKFQLVDNRSVRGIFSTLIEAQAERDRLIAENSFLRFVLQIQQIEDTELVKTGQFLVSLSPVRVFKARHTLLTTRGFWDATLRVPTATPQTIATFSFGMLLLPSKLLYTHVIEDQVETFVQRSDPAIPDVLLDDAGWFVYESFARIVTGTTNHDPPFHSKSKRNVRPGDVLCAVCGFGISDAVDNLKLTFGVRFRCLLES